MTRSEYQRLIAALDRFLAETPVVDVIRPPMDRTSAGWLWVQRQGSAEFSFALGPAPGDGYRRRPEDAFVDIGIDADANDVVDCTEQELTEMDITMLLADPLDSHLRWT